MALTIDEIFKAAYNDESEWKKVLLCTGMLYVGEKVLAVSPPPTTNCEYEQYKYNLGILLLYTNDNLLYKDVVEALSKYVNDFGNTVDK